MLGGMEIIIIILAVVLLLFGAKKIPEFARNLGKASAEFRRGKLMVEKEIQEADFEENNKNRKKTKNKPASKIKRAARDLGIDIKGKTDDELKKEIVAKMV